VRRTPDAVAVVAEDVELSYADLDEAANHLAHQLVALGLRRGDHVGVCRDRRAGLVVALLAVLKAGCAYVPVDPDDPPARIATQLADAEARLVLADARAELPAVAQRGARDADPQTELTPAVLPVPPDAELVAARATAAPDVVVQPADPAYVIFTSGSTGRPKGVVVGHRAICNRLKWTQDEFGLTADDHVLQKTPTTFDVSVWEFFWPLTTGARLVVARPGGHRDPEYLTRVVNDESVTVLHFVPSMLRAFLDADGPRRCPGVRLVISSGEALPRALHREFTTQSDAELANLYGPTEAAVDVTSWRCRADEGDGPVPIGHPIANMRAHVLDRRRRMVPVGVPGELSLGGVGLAEGYHGRPELTAERFVTHTWPDGTTERLYRTGDLVRRRADGALEYLGRDDDQVKIRGMRVEIGEIEAALVGAIPSKAVAVVLSGEQLVAYYVGSDDCVTLLREHCAERLPKHLTPSVWVPVAELPLSATGKVDRHALPDPAPGRVAGANPTTPTERAVAALWVDVLEIADVAADVPFADLGGHSLAAVRLAARVRHELGVPVTVADLLEHDTVAAAAALVDAGKASAAQDGATVVRLRRTGDRPPLWLFHPVGGSVFCYRALAEELLTELPLRAVAGAGLLTGYLPHSTVAQMAAHYVTLMDPVGPVHLFGWSFGAVLAHEVACLLHDRGGVASLTMLDAAFPDQVDAAALTADAVVDLLVAEVLGLSGGKAAVGRGTPDERLRQLASLPETGLDLAQLRARARVLATNLAAHRGHRPKRYPGPAHYLEGRDGRVLGSARAWRTMVDGPFPVHDLEADHYELLRPPHVRQVAALVEAAVSEGENT